MGQINYTTILAKDKTIIYLKVYMAVLTALFIIPLILTAVGYRNIYLLLANIFLYEANMFLSLVLMVYTIITKYENKYWKFYTLYFVLSITYLVLTIYILKPSAFA